MSVGERSRTFTWADPAAMAAAGLRRPGIDYLREIAEGRVIHAGRAHGDGGGTVVRGER